VEVLLAFRVLGVLGVPAVVVLETETEEMEIHPLPHLRAETAHPQPLVKGIMVVAPVMFLIMDAAAAVVLLL
jgi:hypothetical protein